MEQTIGKRIVQYRKAMGLTQDQLAEKLGVTAQAVSKWENDQSCPDISLLPKLAEIFGTTTDALLGRETPEEPIPVRTAEVVEDTPKSKGGWEFHWDSGSKEGAAFALLVLLVGLLTLAVRIMQWDVSFWQILWPCALLTVGVRVLFKRLSFFGVGCILFGGYFLLDNLDLLPFVLGKEYVFPVLLILFGLSLLADLPKKRKHRVSPETGKKTTREYSTREDGFSYDASFGGERQEIFLDVLREGEINCNFGDYEVDLQGVKTLAPGAKLAVDCSFGQVTVLVPMRFRVVQDASSAFGDVTVEDTPASEAAGVLRVDADASFGRIVIKYI